MLRFVVTLLGLAACLPACNTRKPVDKGTAPAASNATPAVPAVSANAASSAASPSQAAAPSPEVLEQASKGRVYAMARNVWVRGAPGNDNQWLGFLWFGSSVALRETEPVPGTGCQGKWYAVEPRGFVCVDDVRATLDLDNPLLRGVAPYAPQLDSPWPHPHYGESLGSARYRWLPTVEEQRRHEPRVELPAEFAGLSGAGPKAEPDLGLPELPRWFQEDRSWVLVRSAVGWTKEVQYLGRTWVLTGDLAWMPKDRIEPYPKITFQGVHLGKDVQLPLAFFRKEDRPQYSKGSDGQLMQSDQTFKRLSFVQLTGNEIEQGGALYLETKTPGLFVAKEDAVLPELRKETPWGAPTLHKDESGKTPGGRATWIETSILGGWLIAYEGTEPVFATLISPGRGGAPIPGKDPVSTASTPTGFFRITGKFATANMVAPNELLHADVPWAQNFSGPHAIHGAYWHNSWGELKSGGCINLSPLDAKWMYEFTEPAVPTGWHGVRWLPDQEPSTYLIINKR